MFPIDINISAPVKVGDLVARLVFENGTDQRVVLRDGKFSGSVPSRVTHVHLVTDPPPEEQGPLQLGSTDDQGRPDGQLVDLDIMFEQGYPVPPDGRLQMQLYWGAACHTMHLPDAPEGKRF